MICELKIFHEENKVKNILLVILRLSLACTAVCHADIVAAKTSSLKIDKALIAKLSAITPDESNANTVATMLGEPAACLPSSTQPTETWVCQWKVNPASNRLESTLNITFEAGMIAQIVGIDASGKYIVSTHQGS
jgi:hypothetical protein